jgi:putative addiction module killer protein
MEAEPIDVKIYVTPDGVDYFSSWLHGMKDSTARRIVRARIARLRLGLFGDSKSLGDGVYELRISYGPGFCVYYGRKGPRVVILLAGGDKSKQRRDIILAKRLWADYGSEDDAS